MLVDRPAIRKTLMKCSAFKSVARLTCYVLSLLGIISNKNFDLHFQVSKVLVMQRKD